MPKRNLRKELSLKRLLHQGDDTKKLKDKNISESLEQLPAFKKAKRILFYAPIQGEVDTFELVTKYINKKEIFFPRTDQKDHTLHLHKVANLNELEKGKFSILEPLETSAGYDPESMELAIIAGIAFDLYGHRIGFGMGYYDRLLKNTKCLKIGLAYEFQIIENVPGTEDYDVPVDKIITEKRIINCIHKS